MTKFIAAFAAASLIASPALAGERSIAVGHADLDLNSDAGRRALDHRLHAAIAQLCGSYAAADSDQVDRIMRCEAEARRGIASQLRTRRNATAVARR